MATRRRNIDSEIKAFWKRVVQKRGLEAAVSVSTDDSGQTVIVIEDELPYMPFLRPMRSSPRFVVSMKGFLSAAHFGKSALPADESDAKMRPTPKGQINRNRNKQRGRAVFLSVVDRDGNEEQLAAISFHIDEAKDAPLILRSIALRVDSQERNDLSRAAAGWLLAYLVEASRQARGEEEVGADSGRMGNLPLVESLGFQKRPKPEGFKVMGSYIAFRPPWTTRGSEAGGRAPTR